MFQRAKWAFRRFLLHRAHRFTVLLGHLHAPWSIKLITGVHYQALEPLLTPGDVLMSRTDGEATTLFIPGFWSHGAVYVGNGLVIEAIGEGVIATDLVTWVTSKDYVRALRPTFATKAQAGDAAAWCFSALGKPYDYDFASGNQAFYCFELTYAAYQAALGVASPWKLRTTLGVETVIGDDFDQAVDKWRTVWDSRRWRLMRVLGMPVLADV